MKETGGPAFPIYTDDMPIEGSPGMTLRDYFAAKAMQVLLKKDKSDPYRDYIDVAKDCYTAADCMLTERER